MEVVAAPVAALAPQLDANQFGVTGPHQQGRGVRGQYVYWITLPMPKAQTVTEHGVKTARLRPRRVHQAQGGCAKLGSSPVSRGKLQK